MDDIPSKNRQLAIIPIPHIKRKYNYTKKTGAPSVFSKAYQKLSTAFEEMKQGASIKEVAVILGVARTVIYQWMDDEKWCNTAEKKEFLDTIKKGVEESEAWWEREGRQNIHNKDFNAVSWYMNMRNRFGWSDNININQTTTIKIQAVREKANTYLQLEDDEINQRLVETTQNRASSVH